ncbi:MAG: hypothetical protein OXC93_13305, partial [Rhodospirillaceae bacterium]|nr:hypothetical protein [Rhodospirillaceae bacterium]
HPSGNEHRGDDMTTRKTDTHSTSRREQEHAEMLEAAVARPGVREVMQVYGGWQEKDRGLEAYRSATKEAQSIVTTNSSNAC